MQTHATNTIRSPTGPERMESIVHVHQPLSATVLSSRLPSAVPVCRRRPQGKRRECKWKVDSHNSWYGWEGAQTFTAAGRPAAYMRHHAHMLRVPIRTCSRIRTSFDVAFWRRIVGQIRRWRICGCRNSCGHFETETRPARIFVKSIMDARSAISERARGAPLCL